MGDRFIQYYVRSIAFTHSAYRLLGAHRLHGFCVTVLSAYSAM